MIRNAVERLQNNMEEIIMKKILALALCLMLVLGLAACGGNETPDTTPSTTEATNAPGTETTNDAVEKPAYKITVLAEDGTPFAGLVVQLCNDQGCNPAVTDVNGVATVFVTEYRDDYHANVTNLPEGYEYAGEATEFYFENGATEVTITLKAIA